MKVLMDIGFLTIYEHLVRAKIKKSGKSVNLWGGDLPFF